MHVNNSQGGQVSIAEQVRETSFFQDREILPQVSHFMSNLIKQVEKKKPTKVYLLLYPSSSTLLYPPLPLPPFLCRDSYK